MKPLLAIPFFSLGAHAGFDAPWESCPEIEELRVSAPEFYASALKCMGQIRSQKSFQNCMENRDVDLTYRPMMQACWAKMNAEEKLKAAADERLMNSPPIQMLDMMSTMLDNIQDGSFDEMTFDMSMNQLGSNFFVGGDFIVPDNCAGLTLPEGVSADDVLAQQTAEDDTTMGMSMNQIGSNYFVMGNYVRPDKQFIDVNEFNNCFTDDNMILSSDNQRTKDMKLKNIYDCVFAAEKIRRDGNVGKEDQVQSGGMPMGSQ